MVSPIGKVDWCVLGPRFVRKEHILKSGFPLIVVVAALLHLLPFRSDPGQQPVELSAGETPLENNRTIPYEKIPAPRKPTPAQKFGGYPCIGDCSNDKAGYRWARQNGITDPDSCTGNTGAFIEGCRVYARQRIASPLKN